MKQVLNNKIINKKNTDNFDNKFLFGILETKYQEIDTIFLSELLEERKNLEMLEKAKIKPAIYSNVYSPEDELEIFKDIFNDAIKNGKKIHIIWITLKEEIELLEEYYEKLGFLREDINCFAPNFSVPLVTASVKIENLMRRWSDYKRMGKQIFFNPPVRESWEVKAMFKWINRWVIAGIHITKHKEEINDFLSTQVKEENILPITLWKVLKYNLESIWFTWENQNLIIDY